MEMDTEIESFQGLNDKDLQWEDLEWAFIGFFIDLFLNMSTLVVLS